MALDDASLMRAIAAGDQNAMQKLYDRHCDLIFSLCRRIVGQRNDADQVLLDVFFELWRRAKEYDPDRSSPRGYLITLARSRSLDCLRRRSLDTATPREDEGETSASLSPLQQTDDKEQAELVRAALAELDEDQRLAIESAYFSGLSHSQIAEKLGQPLGTVKTRIRNGLCRLRDRLSRGTQS